MPDFPFHPISAPSTAAIRPAGETPRAAGSRTFSPAPFGQVESMGERAPASVDEFPGGRGRGIAHHRAGHQRAELAFEMFQQVRNKVVGAYQEIMRMQM